MNTIVFKSTKRTILASLLIMFLATGCERSVDGLDEPGFTTNPEVFIDGFSAGLEYFPYADSKQDAFSVDSDVTYDDSDASMRFDVPNVGNPSGAYAGAIFRDENGGRDLSGYNALTFYAKATTAGTINDIGFGQDFMGNEYAVTLNNLRLATYWQKYIVPIPDASVLTSQQGMFWYAEGPEDGDGYSFWVDELKYENLGTIAQPRPAINNGNTDTLSSFNGTNLQVSGLTYTVNQANGVDVTVSVAPAYYSFSSSNTDVATVNGNGSVSVVGQGLAEITANLGGEQANGLIVVESMGDFVAAPTPTQAPENVISIFSDAYENVPVSFYNGFYEPFQTTTSNDFSVNGDNILGYENFNFVGIEFNPGVASNPVPTIDGTSMTNLTMDVFILNDVPQGSALTLTLRDFGADNTFDGGDDVTASTTIFTPTLVAGQWITIDLDISGMATKANLGQIVIDSDTGTAFRGEAFYVDNLYLYQ